MSWASEHLDGLVARAVTPAPVVGTLKLGLLDEWRPGFAAKRWQSSPDLLLPDGTMFGGYIAALADQMLAFAAMTVLPDGHLFRTINLGVQFLRIGRANPLWIEGRVTAQSKSLITVEADFLREPDRTPIARAYAQQMVTQVAGPPTP